MRTTVAGCARRSRLAKAMEPCRQRSCQLPRGRAVRLTKEEFVRSFVAQPVRSCLNRTSLVRSAHDHTHTEHVCSVSIRKRTNMSQATVQGTVNMVFLLGHVG